MMMGRDGALGILIGAAVGTCSLLLVGCGSRPSRLPEEPVSTAYFTLGSSKEEVQGIRGTPTGIGGDWWFYGALVHGSGLRTDPPSPGEDHATR